MVRGSLEGYLNRSALCTDNVGLHDLNNKLNDIIKNKKSSNVNITKKEVKPMDNLHCGCCGFRRRIFECRYRIL